MVVHLIDFICHWCQQPWGLFGTQHHFGPPCLKCGEKLQPASKKVEPATFWFCPNCLETTPMEPAGF